MTTATAAKIAKTDFLYPCPVEGCEKGYENKKKLQAHFNFSHRDMKLSTHNLSFEADEMSPEERKAASGGGVPEGMEDGAGQTGAVQAGVNQEAERRLRVGEAIERTSVTQPPNTLRVVPDDPSTLLDPRDQVEAVARQLGIGPASASAMANYLSKSYDLDSPDAVWTALQECTEVSPSQRKRFWRTWMSHRGVRDLPDDLVRRVDASVTGQGPGQPKGGEEPIEKPRRLYMALNGDVVPTDDDEVGLSWAQAMQAANLQAERLNEKDARRVGQQQNGEAVLVEMIKQSGAKDLAMLTAVQELGKRPDQNGSLKEILEVAQTMTGAQLATLRAENEGKFSLLTEQMKHQNETLAGALEKLGDAIKSAGTKEEKKSFFDEFFEKVPGARDAMMGFFDPSKRSQSDSTVVNLTGPDGKPQQMTLEVYERLEGIRNRREAVGLVREGLPQLLDVGGKLAQALQRANGTEEAGPPALTEGGKGAPSGPSLRCIKCHVPFIYNAGAQAVQCPACGELQTPDGRRVHLEVEPPAVPAQAVNGQAPPLQTPAPAQPQPQAQPVPQGA